MTPFHQADREPIGGLRRAWRRLSGSIAPGGTVLAYHGVRIGNGPANVGTMHVPEARLLETVRALKQMTTLIPLGELITRHRRGLPTKGLSALTFDDAYVSAGNVIGRIAETESVPMTTFVVLDAARTGKPFWWDRIDGAFAAATAERWRAFEDACGLPPAFREGQPAEMGRLRPFRQWMLAEHRGRWSASLEEPLAALEWELGITTAQRPMTFDELDKLLENPLIDVGAHTVSHPVLPLLSDDELRREIRESHRELRARYPRTLDVLTPPYGLYDERTLTIGREEGMSACLTLDPTVLDDTTSGDVIPRIGMTANCPPWKVVFYALGCWRGVRPHRGAHTYPVLPSTCT